MPLRWLLIRSPLLLPQAICQTTITDQLTIRQLCEYSRIWAYVFKLSRNTSTFSSIGLHIITLSNKQTREEALVDESAQQGWQARSEIATTRTKLKRVCRHFCGRKLSIYRIQGLLHQRLQDQTSLKELKGIKLPMKLETCAISDGPQ